jgi:hypothetical protein
MGHYRLGFSVVAALALTVMLKPAPVEAANAAALALGAAPSLSAGAERIGHRAMHRHRAQSFYCYPKNYWWFYRPYTTAEDGHARCMPYFHYLGPPGRRGARSEPYIK